MFKNKIRIFFIAINIIIPIQTVVGAEQKDIECTAEAKCIADVICIIPKINFHLFEATISPTVNSFTEEITACSFNVEELKRTLHNFPSFKPDVIQQIISLKNNFTLHTPNKLKKAIDQMASKVSLPKFEANETLVTNIMQPILTFLDSILEKLSECKKKDTLTDCRNEVDKIKNEFNDFFSGLNIDDAITWFDVRTIQLNEAGHNVSSWLNSLNPLKEYYEAKNKKINFPNLLINIIALKKKVLTGLGNKQPSLFSNKDFNDIIPTAIKATKLISWMPFTERICNVAISDNKITKKLITYACGQEEYDKLQGYLFPMLRILNEKKLIRFFALHIHDFLSNPIISNFFTIISKYKQDQDTNVIFNNFHMQQFLDLIKFLHSAHIDSFKKLQNQYAHRVKLYTRLNTLQDPTTPHSSFVNEVPHTHQNALSYLRSARERINGEYLMKDLNETTWTYTGLIHVARIAFSGKTKIENSTAWIQKKIFRRKKKTEEPSPQTQKTQIVRKILQRTPSSDKPVDDNIITNTEKQSSQPKIVGKILQRDVTSNNLNDKISDDVFLENYIKKVNKTPSVINLDDLIKTDDKGKEPEGDTIAKHEKIKGSKILDPDTLVKIQSSSEILTSQKKKTDENDIVGKSESGLSFTRKDTELFKREIEKLLGEESINKVIVAHKKLNLIYDTVYQSEKLIGLAKLLDEKTTNLSWDDIESHLIKLRTKLIKLDKVKKSLWFFNWQSKRNNCYEIEKTISELEWLTEKTVGMTAKWNDVLPTIDNLYGQLEELNEEKKKLWFFNWWSKSDNEREINKVTDDLQHYIDINNNVRIRCASIDMEDYKTIHHKARQLVKTSMTTIELQNLVPSKRFPKERCARLKERLEVFRDTAESLCKKNKDAQYILTPVERRELQYQIDYSIKLQEQKTK